MRIFGLGACCVVSMTMVVAIVMTASPASPTDFEVTEGSSEVKPLDEHGSAIAPTPVRTKESSVSEAMAGAGHKDWLQCTAAASEAGELTWTGFAAKIPRATIHVEDEALIWRAEHNRKQRKVMKIEDYRQGGVLASEKRDSPVFGQIVHGVESASAAHALVLVVASEQDLASRWTAFLEQVQAAEASLLPLFLWMGSLPASIQKVPQACLKRLRENPFEDARITRYIKAMPALMLAMEGRHGMSFEYTALLDWAEQPAGTKEKTSDAVDIKHYLVPDHESGCKASVVYANKQHTRIQQVPGVSWVVRNDNRGREFLMNWIDRECDNPKAAFLRPPPWQNVIAVTGAPHPAASPRLKTCDTTVHLERVPFYIFEEAPFNILDQVRKTNAEDVEWYKMFKHGGEIWFIDTAYMHPWRVSKWEEAEIIIVPLPLGLCSKGRELEITHIDGYALCGHKVEEAVVALKEHPLYQQEKYRRRLLMITTDWTSRGHKLDLPDLVLGSKIKKDPDMGQRCGVVVPMMSLLENAIKPSMDDDFESRPIRSFFIGHCLKETYIVRRKVFRFFKGMMRNVDSTDIDVFVSTDAKDAGVKSGNFPWCEKDCEVAEPGCVACITDPRKEGAVPYNLIRKSKFAWHIEGDVLSSNRIYDILTAGAVPLVVGSYMYGSLPFKDHIPWSSMCINVGFGQMDSPFEGEFDECKDLTANKISIHGARAAREAVLKHAKGALWQVSPMDVVSNTIYGARQKCFTAEDF